MKKLVIISILLTIGYLGSLAQTDEFYFYKGEKINITLNNEMHYVSMMDSISFKDIFLNSGFVVTEKKNGVETYNNQRRYWKIIQVKSTEQEISRKNDFKTILESNYKIDHVGPVIGYKFPVAVSEYFYVKLKDKKNTNLLFSEAKKRSCDVIGNVNNMPSWYILRAPNNSNALNMANSFFSTNNFEEVDPGFILNYRYTCIDDDEFDQQWGLENGSGIDINACEAWEIDRGNSNVVVGVIDQGIDSNHDEFAINLLSSSYNAEDNTTPAQLEGEHGTHVAGIIGANQNSNQVSGIAPLASLLAISHSLLTSPTMSAELASGISWAHQNGADIINNSWGDQGGALYNNLHSALLEDAINNAITNGRNGLGCIITFAAGNHSPTTDYPANYRDEIICVGSINSSGARASTSAYGTKLDVVAPGVNILSTIPNNQTGLMSGTSMATPHVSGVAALVLSVNPKLTQNQVRDIIESTCTKVGSYSY